MKAVSKAIVICTNAVIIAKTFQQLSRVYKVVPHALPHLILLTSSEKGIIPLSSTLFYRLYKAVTFSDLSKVMQLVRDEVRTLPQVFWLKTLWLKNWGTLALVAKKGEKSDSAWVCFSSACQITYHLQSYSHSSVYFWFHSPLLTTPELSLPWEDPGWKSYPKDLTRTNYLWVFNFNNSLLTF